MIYGRLRLLSVVLVVLLLLINIDWWEAIIIIVDEFKPFQLYPDLLLSLPSFFLTFSLYHIPKILKQKFNYHCHCKDHLQSLEGAASPEGAASSEGEASSEGVASPEGAAAAERAASATRNVSRIILETTASHLL